MDLMKQLYEITRELLTSRNVDDVLSRILDAAMRLSKAERGFLLIQEGQEFDVRVARNLSREAIDGDEFRGSLTAVREAIREGKPMVTDNALMDARFKTSESVQQLDLKSILVLPLKTPEGILGGLYLDHRYRTNLFGGADLKLLEMFADQAALALQKAQMITNLKRSNDALNRTVTEQSTEITALKKEVTEQREALTHEYGEIIGRAPAMIEVLQLVDRLVDTTIPVWIFGESGTGKEMIARALHMKGPRAKKAFVTENCSSLPETLLESELFGHKKGSFTHADRDKKGLLQHADGGTVFLDEIADMSPAMQSKMLRFLQEGEIRPLGSNEIIKVDVRVVSASNRDLHKLITEGKFREDLFYRLNGITVPLPPLRERIEDIPLLADHFLQKIAKEIKKGPYEITPEALGMLTDYAWPGNVRELENTLRSACLFHYKNKLLPKSFHFKKTLYGSRHESISAAPASTAPLPEAAKPETGAELNLLLKALRDTNYHKSEAAKALGISRRYLYKQLTKYAVPLQRIEMKEFVERTIGPKR